jgi:transcriptional regulator with XRE-family HTH domain
MKCDPDKSRTLAKAIGAAIAARRQMLGLTQGDMAERLEMEQESISRIETGRVMLNLGRLMSIADALDCSIESLLQPSSPRKQDQALVMENLLATLDEGERAFILGVVRDFTSLAETRRKKR